MIETESALQEFIAIAQRAKVVGLDTEFVGEGRYRTLLCLIQLAAPHPRARNGSPRTLIELIDPLSGALDLSPLGRLLADPQVQVITHAGRQDVALLRRALSTEVNGLFDTQLAAGFLGLPAQRSYEGLLSEVLSVQLRKSASFTRWEARPLTEEQLSYAKEDVEHLIALAHALQDRLRSVGRLQWALQECEAIARASDERDLQAVFTRLPRIASLSRQAQALAHALVHWREDTAAAADRPVQSVLSDAALLEIARRAPRTAQELAKIRGVQHSLVRRCGEQIVQAIAQARSRGQLPPLPLQRSVPTHPSDASLVALSEALARDRARQSGLAYELVTSRAELQAIVAAKRLREPEPAVRPLRGWRRQLLGEELLRLLDGELALSVAEGQLQVRPPAAS